MTIVATTDFSSAAHEAGAAAAAIAARLGEPLLLAHAGALPSGSAPAEAVALQQRLDAEAASLARSGAAVQTSLLEGNPAAAILACIDRVRPRLVIAAAGSGEKRRKLGRVAEAIAQGSSRPLLIVRGAAPFLEWASGARPLRVLVGDDFSAFTEPAYQLVRELRAAGPCEVTVAHLYSPLAEHGRAGFLGGAAESSSVEKRIEEDLQARVQALGEAGARVRTAASYGRIADPLVALAAQEQADLLVLGTHQRNRLERAWQGSVSHLTLQLAPMAVASVPFDEAREARSAAVPPVRRVLACTDFSPLGDSAIGHACSVLGGGGEVTALHVVPVWPPLPAGLAEDAGKLLTAEERKAALGRLQALVPADAAARKIVFRTEVAAGGRVAPVICRIAERENVDLVCLSSHGRSGITRAVLGSVAGGVIAQSRRPVLVVRPRAS